MNAKRGYLPEDDRNFSVKALETMKVSSRHICYLINEDYDMKTASTFVGNHYNLTERQRLALMRSLATTQQLSNRKVKEKTDVSGEEVWIDGFNTIITLEVMLSNSLLFNCMDGTIRDLAALRGTYRIIEETAQAVQILLSCLTQMNVKIVHILLDKPVSNSRRLKTLIADMGENVPFSLDIQILRDVDRALWDKENVITSDSIILDHCISWVNLMKLCTANKNARLLQVW